VQLVADIRAWNWTAIGTLVLAIATGVLAFETWGLARGARDELKESQRQTKESQRQADIAQRTLLAQDEPMILDMAVDQSVDDRPMFQVTNCPDGEPVRGQTLVLMEPGAICSIPFVNVGRGPAVLGVTRVFLPDVGEAASFFQAQPRFREIERPNLPRNETTRLNIEFLGGDTGWSEWHRVAARKEVFWTQIEYGTGALDQSVFFEVGPTRNPRALEEWSIVRAVLRRDDPNSFPFAISS
jgi:hypothetical protein